MPAPARRPPPVVQVVAILAKAKACGAAVDEFDVLWREAVRAVIWPHDTIHRQQWREAIDYVKEEMRAAYAGVETPVAEVFRRIPPYLLEFDEDRAHDLDRVAA